MNGGLRIAKRLNHRDTPAQARHRYAKRARRGGFHRPTKPVAPGFLPFLFSAIMGRSQHIQNV